VFYCLHGIQISYDALSLAEQNPNTANYLSIQRKSYIIHKLCYFANNARSSIRIYYIGVPSSPRMSLGWNYFTCPVHPVRKRYALAFPPRRVGSLRGRHGRRSHVPSASAVHQHLETYLCDPERWLKDWINASKITAMLVAKAVGRTPKPQPLQLFGEPILWVDTARYLGGEPCYAAYLVDAHRTGEKESGIEIESFGKWSLHQERYSAVKVAHPSSDRLRVPHLEVCGSLQYQENAGASVQVSSHCY